MWFAVFLGNSYWNLTKMHFVSVIGTINHSLNVAIKMQTRTFSLHPPLRKIGSHLDALQQQWSQLCSPGRVQGYKTLLEAQRTQDIEFKTWIVSKSWNKSKFQLSTFSLPALPGDHLSHLALLAHIGLDHHVNDNYQPQITLLASSASIEMASSSARVTSVSKSSCMYVCTEAETHRPDPRDTWVR